MKALGDAPGPLDQLEPSALAVSLSCNTSERGQQLCPGLEARPAGRALIALGGHPAEPKQSWFMSGLEVSPGRWPAQCRVVGPQFLLYSVVSPYFSGMLQLGQVCPDLHGTPSPPHSTPEVKGGLRFSWLQT